MTIELCGSRYKLLYELCQCPQIQTNGHPHQNGGGTSSLCLSWLGWKLGSSSTRCSTPSILRYDLTEAYTQAQQSGAGIGSAIEEKRPVGVRLNRIWVNFGLWGNTMMLGLLPNIDWSDNTSPQMEWCEPIDRSSSHHFQSESSTAVSKSDPTRRRVLVFYHLVGEHQMSSVTSQRTTQMVKWISKWWVFLKLTISLCM